MTLAAIKRLFQPGDAFDVTNHYITKPDHPKFGTTRRTVQRTNTSSIYFDGEKWGLAWPKAAQVKVTDDGTIEFYGGGGGQKPDDLFLTFRPVTKGA